MRGGKIFNERRQNVRHLRQLKTFSHASGVGAGGRLKCPIYVTLPQFQTLSFSLFRLFTPSQIWTSNFIHLFNFEIIHLTTAQNFETLIFEEAPNNCKIHLPKFTFTNFNFYFHFSPLHCDHTSPGSCTPYPPHSIIFDLLQRFLDCVNSLHSTWLHAQLRSNASIQHLSHNILVL